MTLIKFVICYLQPLLQLFMNVKYCFHWTLCRKRSTNLNGKIQGSLDANIEISAQSILSVMKFKNTTLAAKVAQGKLLFPLI